MTETTISRLSEAFLRPESALGKGLLERCTTSHWDPMLGEAEAFRCKLARCQYIAELLDVEGRRILDFGSGMGLLACYLAWRGAKHVVAVELLDEHRAASQYLAEEVFHTSNLAFARTVEGLEPESFDVAILANVISHVYQPARAVCAINDLLVEGGCIFIEDNNNLLSPIVQRRLPSIWATAEASYRMRRAQEVGEAGAQATYGLTLQQASYWRNADTSRLTSLRQRAPLDPELAVYHENAFRPGELATLLFNAGFSTYQINPKHVFDFKERPVISRLFGRYPRVALRVAPAFELLAVKV